MPSEVVYDSAEALEAGDRAELPYPVSVEELYTFERQYYAGKFQQCRFGQAFMNEFYDRPAVAAIRTDSLLWEAKGAGPAKARMRELGLIF